MDFILIKVQKTSRARAHGLYSILLLVLKTIAPIAIAVVPSANAYLEYLRRRRTKREK